MIQKKYLCRNMEAAADAVKEIKKIVNDTPHKSAVVTIYEKGLTGEEVDRLLQMLKAEDGSKVLTAGVSLTLVAELMPEGEGTLLNLILTDEADIEVVSIPCLPGGEDEAAAILRDRLDHIDDVKAVELFGSNMALNTTRFMEASMEGHEDVVLFGTYNLRNLGQKLSVDEGEIAVDVEQIDPALAAEELIIGEDIIYDGFVAVVFSGEKLNALSEYALGWNPIGRALPLELGKNPAKGETVIEKINGRPAVDIYREYLGVYPDNFLISNVCEFPLVVERDGINICMIPIEYGKEGELYFMMTIREGEEVRFTFASHEEVLASSRVSLEKMEEFRPEALFLIPCGNRINFLKEDAYLEWDGFRSVAEGFALMHGGCELYYHKGRGGVLNSAHLAIGLREGDAEGEAPVHEHLTVESLRHGRTLSLSDRMSVFLSRITTELLDMAAEARDANNAKSAFLSHMSHEIRTPINAILGLDEMIIRESGEDETVEYAESIKSAGSNLLGIVNDILDFSKIEAGKMRLVPVDYELSSVINDMYNLVGIRAREKGLEVKLDVDKDLPSVLNGDEMRIKQVVTNLLTNAVKYTEKGSVTLKMTGAGKGDGDKTVRIRVSVLDTGIGIKPGDMEKLFDEYERVDERRNRSIEGTGLGLAITKELLDLMGSRLEVASTYGQGSEFGFEIVQGIVNDKPVGDVNARFDRKPARKRRVRFTAEDARILVVDDSAVNLNVVVKLVKDTRIQIDTAKSGEEAIDLVCRQEYDVILLDHMMPGMDGPKTLANMMGNKDNLSKAAPVISLTANASDDARDEYISMGYKDYLTKPINPTELEDMLFYYIPPEKIRTVEE